MFFESTDVIELFWSCFSPTSVASDRGSNNGAEAGGGGREEEEDWLRARRRKDPSSINDRGAQQGGGRSREELAKREADTNKQSMGDSCSKMKDEDEQEEATDRSKDANAVNESPIAGTSKRSRDAAAATPFAHAGHGGGDFGAAASGAAAASAFATAESPAPASPASERRQSRRLQALSPRALRNSRLLRVGSRRAPNSPARASNYGHVHDAVNLNFSALSGTVDGFSAATGLPLGVVGLRNLGNTCFLNSSLQCLSATIPLTDYFLGYDYRKELNVSNPLGTGGKLAIAYAELMKAMWLNEPQSPRNNPPRRAAATARGKAPSTVSILKPTSFKAALETFAPQFLGNHQHDAQELLAFLLDGIHEDLNRIQRKPYVEDPDFDGTSDERDAATAWRNYLQRDKSLVVDIFQGQEKNTRQCCVCRHVNVKFEPIMYLSLPLSDRCRTLDDCVRLYLQEERLTGDNRWYCSKCKDHRDAIQKTTIWVLPPILIVHLKRFKFNEYGRIGSKNNANIEYPFTWDLSHLSHHPSGTCRYDLYAVANHVGGMGSGHYTAYGKNRFDDAWYEFNDSSCRRVTEETLERNRSSAYLLFYNRVEQAPPPFLAPNGNGTGTSSGLRHRAPLVRRQSVSRPDLWPHAQVQNNQYREFARQSARAIPDPPLFSLDDQGEGTAKLPPTDEGKSVEL